MYGRFLLYNLKFTNDIFIGAKYIEMILNYKNYPHASALLSRTFEVYFDPPRNNVTKKRPLPNYRITYSKYGRLILPSPYRTQCIDYKIVTGINLNENLRDYIISKSIETFNKWPFSVITNDTADFSIITSTDMRNITFDKIYNQLDVKCFSKFSNPECSDVLYQTELVEMRIVNDLTIRAESSRDVSYFVTLLPKLELVEVVIYLFTCMGMWLGASVFGLNQLVITI